MSQESNEPPVEPPKKKKKGAVERERLNEWMSKLRELVGTFGFGSIFERFRSFTFILV